MPAFQTELDPAIFQLRSILEAGSNRESRYNDLANYLRLAYPNIGLEEIYKTIQQRRIEEEQNKFKYGSAFGRNNIQTNIENNLGLENIYRGNFPKTSDRLWM